jgi:thioredoxin-dependent peroxiredoxin
MPSLRLTIALAITPMVLAAQQSSPASTRTTPPLAVGAVAPDFTMKGATRYGLLSNPVRLSDFKRKTVVLAFFYKARTSG